jgi:hypothetical protein
MMMMTSTVTAKSMLISGDKNEEGLTWPKAKNRIQEKLALSF